jgi:uncharacterized membrane protein
MMHEEPANIRFWRRWAVAMAAAGAVLGLAVLPPFVPEAWQAVLMHAFSGVCHQLPDRSPHWAGEAIAVCDRCLGIYAGLLLGIAGSGLTHTLLRKVHGYAPWFLGAILVPLGVDWLGPVLGWWSNTPLSRGITGALVGLGAGALIVAALANGVSTGTSPAEKEEAAA